MGRTVGSGWADRSGFAFRVLKQRYPQLINTGFKRALYAALWSDWTASPCEDWDEFSSEQGLKAALRHYAWMRPDGFFIDQQCQRIRVYEIVVTHPIPVWKHEGYAWFDDWLSCWGPLTSNWGVDLVRVDETGAETPLSLIYTETEYALARQNGVPV
jgi:hypothetical protein